MRNFNKLAFNLKRIRYVMLVVPDRGYWWNSWCVYGNRDNRFVRPVTETQIHGLLQKPVNQIYYLFRKRFLCSNCMVHVMYVTRQTGFPYGSIVSDHYLIIFFQFFYYTSILYRTTTDICILYLGVFLFSVIIIPG